MSTKTKLTQSDWSFIVADLLPIAGVWFFNRSVQEVFPVYRPETIIAGIFAHLKILITGLIKRADEWQTTGGSSLKQPSWYFTLFFMLHYGFFVAIQMGVFFGVSDIGDQYGITFFNFISKVPPHFTNNAYMPGVLS